MKNKTYLLCAILITIVILPAIALAKLGFPLVWLPCLKLIFFNITIAIGEGLIIALVFKTHQRKFRNFLKAIGIMLLANYFSTIFSEFLILPLISNIKTIVLGNAPLYNVFKFIALMAVIAFILSIILEWPFCFWILKNQKHRLRKSLIASPLVHIASYAFLAWIYYSLSSFTIYQELEVTKDLSFSKNNNMWVYYISQEDGDLYKIRPNAAENQKIADTNIECTTERFQKWPYLVLWPKDDEFYDLEIVGRKKMLKTIKRFTSNERLQLNENATPINHQLQSPIHACVSNFKYNNQNIALDIKVGYWAIDGLKIFKSDKQIAEYAFEAPFVLDWKPSQPNILKNDQIIYQLGNQIVLLDIKEKKIGLITIGGGPLVLPEGGVIEESLK